MRDVTAGAAATRSGPPASHALVLIVLIFVPEVSLENVLGDHAAQPVPLFDGMTEMHAAKDTCVVDLFDHILEAVKRMRGPGDGARDGKGNLVRFEKRSHRIHHGFCNAAMIGRILWVTGRHDERYPVRIGHGPRIVIRICIMNCRVRPPKGEVVFGIHAGRARIRRRH
jgi:hypothetical protein